MECDFIASDMEHVVQIGGGGGVSSCLCAIVEVWACSDQQAVLLLRPSGTDGRCQILSAVERALL